jgi:alkylation response protein AidB-like acyl-CoA dehydrogenase
MRSFSRLATVGAASAVGARRFNSEYSESSSVAAGFFRALIQSKEFVPYPAQLCSEDEGDDLSDLLSKAEGADFSKAQGKEGLQTLIESSVFGAMIPSDIGGLGLSHSSLAFACESLALKDPQMPTQFLHHVGSITHLLTVAGSKDQQGRWFPSMSDGSMICGWAMEELESGSDISAIAATAKLSEDASHFILNGVKGPIVTQVGATHYIVAAKSTIQTTASETSSTPVVATRVTLFMVDAKSQGVTVVPKGDGSLSELRLSGVKVPTHDVVGPAGEGFAYYQISKNQANYAIASTILGGCKKVLDLLQEQLAPVCKGNPSGLRSLRCVELAARIYGLESAIYCLTANLDKKVEDCFIESAVVTTFAVDTAYYFQRIVSGMVPFLQQTPQTQQIEKALNTIIQLALVTSETDNLKHVAACCGIEDFGLWFKKTSTLTMMQLRTLRSLGQMARYSGKAPTALANEVAAFEKGVAALGAAVEHVFVKNGLRTKNERIKLERVAEAVGLLYAAATTISRVEKCSNQKQPTANTEVQLAAAFLASSMHDVEILTQQVLKSAQSCDDSLGLLCYGILERYQIGLQQAQAQTPATPSK